MLEISKYTTVFLISFLMQGNVLLKQEMEKEIADLETLVTMQSKGQLQSINQTPDSTSLF